MTRCFLHRIVLVPAIIAVTGLGFSCLVHDRISTFTYMRWLRGFLWAMVALLIAQFIRLMVVRFI